MAHRAERCRTEAGIVLASGKPADKAQDATPCLALPCRTSTAGCKASTEASLDPLG